MTGHGGNRGELAKKLGCPATEILDFSANINPLGPPEYLWNVLARAMPDILHYPDPLADELVTAIAGVHDLPRQQIVAGNGTSELLFATIRALGRRRVVIPVPAYIDYKQACEQAGLAVHLFALQETDNFQPDLDALADVLEPGDLVIIGQPNNPTGCLLPSGLLAECMRQHPDVVFIVDEAFAGFVADYVSLAGKLDNCIVLRSLTKLFAVPGLRLGYLSGPAALCGQIKKQLAPWSVNTLALAAGVAMVGDRDFYKKSQLLVAENREVLQTGLALLPGLTVFPSVSNFLLLALDRSIDSGKLADTLLRDNKIAVRCCGNYDNLDSSYLRVAVRTASENQQLLDALHAQLLPGRRPGQRQKQPVHCPALMLLGTGSDVGKSVLAAGICRILLQDGLRVAPFKAQNMSLNSFVTRDGCEMGRAQVVQAQACRLDPDVRMNPVLLKPNSDVGSQVIVLGKPVGNMKVSRYVAFKQELWQTVCKAYDELALEYDCMVLEGAGSPGEVNLKSHDIVNMEMARYADAGVLLVGDIDRGGVYASFVGHVEVMAPWERSLLVGFVVNRFRGDDSLLGDAHTYIRERTGKPVLGVVPFLHNLDLPQEDSVSFKAGLFDSTRPHGDHVDIALIDLPHISNFTDVEPLLPEKDVHLRIVRSLDDLGSPECIILPGSKNVVADLSYLDSSGLGRAMSCLARKGCEIVGICGGFMMLGVSVADPHGLEGEAGCLVQGLGLLPIDTELAAEKTLTRKQGLHVPSREPVFGYEIHHGKSTATSPVLQFDDLSFCGSMDPTGRVWGSYLHGIFDADAFRRWFINRLRKRKGLAAAQSGVSYNLEPALDRLANTLRTHLDMEALYRIIGL